MSVKYYNNPDYPKFLPIAEYIVDGVPNSIVTHLDNNLIVNDANWANLSTSYAIKNYIDTQVQELVNQPFLYEDYTIVYSSILDINSGYVKGDNYTNIIYPLNDSALINQSDDIVLNAGLDKIIFDKNKKYEISNFYHKEFAEYEEALVNESFEQGFTWIARSDTPDYSFNITSSQMEVEDGHMVETPLGIDANHKLNLSFASSESDAIDCNFSGGSILLEYNKADGGSAIVTDVTAVDTDIMNTASGSEHSFLEDNSLNCYWNIFAIGEERFDIYSNLETLYSPGYKIDDNNDWIIPFNLYTKVETDREINFAQSRNIWLVRFMVQLSPDNNKLNDSIESILLKMDGMTLSLVQDNDSRCRMSINGVSTNIFLSYSDIHNIELNNNADEFVIQIDSVTVFTSNSLNIGASKLYFGGINDDKAFIGNLIVGIDSAGVVSSSIRAIVGDTSDPEDSWSWNLVSLQRANVIKNVEYSNGYMTNGIIRTPVFAPENDSWEFNIRFKLSDNISRTNIVSSLDSYTGLNLLYKNEELHLVLNTNTKNNKGLLVDEPLLDVIIPYTQTNEYAIRVEYTGYEYNVYCDPFALTKIASVSSQEVIKPSHLTIIASENVQIEVARTFVMIADKIWWDFHKLNTTKDFEYNNFEATNGCTLEVDSKGRSILSVPANNYAYASWSETPDNYLVIPFILDDTVQTRMILASPYENNGIRLFVEDNRIQLQYNNTGEWSLPETFADIEENKEFIFKITQKDKTYVLELFDYYYNLQSQDLEIEMDSQYMNRFMLGNTLNSTEPSTVKFVLSELLSSGTFGYNYWNGIGINSFKLFSGASIYLPEYKVLETDLPTFRKIEIDEDKSIDNINRIIYFNGSEQLVTYSNVTDNSIAIMNNTNSNQNQVYVNLTRNTYFLNNSNIDSVAIGGIKNYEANTVNVYTYPRPRNILSNFYGKLVYNPNRIYKGDTYTFDHRENIMLGGLQYKLGNYTTPEYTYEIGYDQFPLNIQVNNNQESNIDVIGDDLVATINVNEASLIPYSRLSDSSCSEYSWQLHNLSINKNSGITSEASVGTAYYYNISDSKSFVSYIGAKLNGNDSLSITGNDREYYNANNGLSMIATSANDKCIVGMTYTNNNESEVYSVHSVCNLIKSGDFSDVTQWTINCQNYVILDYGFVDINNSIFDFSQSIQANIGERILVSYEVSKNPNSSGLSEESAITVDNITKIFSGTGRFEGIFEITSENPVVSINSNGEVTNLRLSNVSVISLGKIRNGGFIDSSYWTEGEGLEYNYGLTIRSLTKVEQTVHLFTNRKYRVSIKIDELTVPFELYAGGVKYLNAITKPGLYTFYFTPITADTLISFGIIQGGSCHISFIDIEEASLVSDPYFEKSSGWYINSDNISLIGNKIFVQSSLSPSEIHSGKLLSNKRMTINWTQNILSGEYKVYVGSDADKTLLGTYSDTGEVKKTLSFTAPNYTECYLYFDFDTKTSVLLNNFELTIDNYAPQFGYNWQKIGGSKLSTSNETFKFSDADSSNILYQYSNEFNGQLDRLYQINIKGLKFESGRGIIVSFGGNDLPVIRYSGEYVGNMGSGNYISIRPESAHTTCTIDEISMLIDTETFEWNKPSDFNEYFNIGLKNISYNQQLSYMEKYNNQLVGLKIDNTYTSGFFDYENKTIDNLEREFVYSINDSDMSNIEFSSTTAELLKVNWIFVDKDYNFIITDKVPYAKLKREISSDTIVWYNMVDKSYYQYKNDKPVYYIGRGYADTNNLKVTDNIQKSRKIKSYSHPVIDSELIAPKKSGLYDIPAMYFHGTDRNIQVHADAGTYLVCVQGTSQSNPYNLDINRIYTYTEHSNIPATWDSNLNMFLNPYTLEEVIYEIYIDESGNVQFYSLIEPEDIVEANETYHRLTYKFNDKEIEVVNEDKSTENTAGYKLYGTVRNFRRVVKWLQ